MAPPRHSPDICSTCRARKVRCDGQKPVCGNCERLGSSCSYSITAKKAPRAPVVRRRAHAACLACHSRRIRCSEGRPSCQRCSRLDLTCTYPAGSAPPETGHLAGVCSSTDGSPPGALALHALRVFFRRVHHIPAFSFLHQACVIGQYRNGDLDRALLLALIGIVSILEDLGEGTRELGDTYIDRAAAMVVDDMEKPTVPRIQALIFIIKYRALKRRFTSVFMLSAIAIRFATGLRLNYEDPHLSFLAGESSRRTMWSLYLIDSTLAAGYQDFALAVSEMIHIKLPCQDANFEMDIPPGQDEHDDNSSQTTPGALCLVVQMAQLRHRVLHFTKRAVRRHPSSNDLVSGIQGLRAELDTFRDQLPTSFKLSKHNLVLQAYSSTISSFVAIHATWHGCQGILHRLVLHGLVEALSAETIGGLDPDFRRSCEVRCFESAKSVTEMLRVVLSLSPESVSLDLDIAVCIYQCLRILVRSYQAAFESVNGTIEDVRIGCHTGLQFLKTIFPDSPAVNAIIEDTETLIKESHMSPSASKASVNDAPPQSESDSKPDSIRAHHVLSKHSLVGQVDIPSRKEEFLLSPSSTGDQMEDTPTSNEATADTLRPIAHTHGNGIVDPTSVAFPDTSSPLNVASWSYDQIDGQLYQFPEINLPDFGLDSSISFPSSWIDGALPDL